MLLGPAFVQSLMATMIPKPHAGPKSYLPLRAKLERQILLKGLSLRCCIHIHAADHEMQSLQSMYWSDTVSELYSCESGSVMAREFASDYSICTVLDREGTVL